MKQDQITQNLLDLHQQTMRYDFRRAALWVWLQDHLSPNDRVLDAGCGTGYMIARLAKSGYAAVGIDFEPKLVQFTQSLVTSQGWSIPIENMTLGSGELHTLGDFDCIFCLDVIEHIEDDLAALVDLRNALKSNGRILLSAPAMPGLYGIRDRQIGHYRRYSSVRLRCLAQEAGLNIATLCYWNAVGLLAFQFFEKVLKRPINDTLRQPSPGRLKTIARTLLYSWLRVELKLPWPAGLSLLAMLAPSRD